MPPGCLSGRSGACRDFGDQGEVNLLEGIGESVPGFLSVTSPPTIVRGVVVIGHQVLDNQRRDAPSGVVRGYDAANDYHGTERTEIENQYSSALVALDVNTGKVAWHFQTVYYDIWDYDLGSQATLVDYPVAEGSVPALVLSSTQAGSPFGAAINAGWRVRFTGLLCTQPPYGGIRAIDLATGSTLWSRPLGEARGLFARARNFGDLKNTLR